MSGYRFLRQRVSRFRILPKRIIMHLISTPLVQLSVLYIVLYCIWTLVIAPLPDFPFRGAPDSCAESEFHAEAHEQLRVKDLPRVPTRRLWGGFEPATLQLQGTEHTPKPPRPSCIVMCCIVCCIVLHVYNATEPPAVKIREINLW